MEANGVERRQKRSFFHILSASSYIVRLHRTLQPKKSLGQHFLHDQNILRKIAALIAPREHDTIVEIGPGTGALTRLLAGRCRLIGIEIDGRAIDGLRREFGETAEILHRDIRDLEPSTLAGSSQIRIAGNIPYNITSDILFWMFEHRRSIIDATLMMQAEVADRLVARPRTKQYGILSVCTQVYAEPRRAFQVSRRCFTPVPDVDSSVVHVRLQEGPDPELDGTFRKLVRGLFGKRRKTVRNGLRYMGYEDPVFAQVSEYLGKRPEELAPQEFITLAERIAHAATAGTTPRSA